MTPVTRADQLPPAPPRSRGFKNFVTAPDWNEPPFELRDANKLTLQVAANAIELRFSRTQPPEPPTWDYPIPVLVGPYGHSGDFGYWQLRDATAGSHGAVTGAAFAE